MGQFLQVAYRSRRRVRLPNAAVVRERQRSSARRSHPGRRLGLHERFLQSGGGPPLHAHAAQRAHRRRPGQRAAVQP